MRELLLNGEIELPSYFLFIANIGLDNTEVAERMFQSVWYHYLLNEGSTSSIYWYEKFDCPSNYNKTLLALSKWGWITSKAIKARNWAEISINKDKLNEYVTDNELKDIRRKYKVNKYVLKNDQSLTSGVTRINGKKAFTGLIRNGFKAASTTEFKFDTKALSKYHSTVQDNLTKSMDKIRDMYPHMRADIATYDNVCLDILQHHIDNPHLSLTMGSSHQDSRGRQIHGGLSKAFNPVSNKDARATLIF